MVVGLCHMGIDPDGIRNQFLGFGKTAGLQRDHPQKMQGIEVLWVLLQDLSIQVPCVREPALSMAGFCAAHQTAQLPFNEAGGSIAFHRRQ